MIVETIYFCERCNHHHNMSDSVCDSCGFDIQWSTNGRCVTKLNINAWWKFWNRKYIAVFTPKEEFTSRSEFNSWKNQKIEEYLSGDHHDVYFGKLKYI